MVAALRRTEIDGVSERTRLAYVWRITETAQLYDYVDRLTNFVQRSSDGSVLTLSPALIKALAVVIYDVSDYTAQINVDDLIVHAKQFEDEERYGRPSQSNLPQLAPRTNTTLS